MQLLKSTILLYILCKKHNISKCHRIFFCFLCIYMMTFAMKIYICSFEQIYIRYLSSIKKQQHRTERLIQYDWIYSPLHPWNYIPQYWHKKRRKNTHNHTQAQNIKKSIHKGWLFWFDWFGLTEYQSLEREAEIKPLANRPPKFWEKKTGEL